MLKLKLNQYYIIILRLYWVDSEYGNIISSNIDNKEDLTTLLRSGAGTYGIAAIKVIYLFLVVLFSLLFIIK